MLILTLLNLYSSYAASNAFDIGASGDVLSVYKDKVVLYLQQNILNRPLVPNAAFTKFEGAFRVDFAFEEPEVYYVNIDDISAGFSLQSPNIIAVNIEDLNAEIRFYWTYSTAISSDNGEGYLNILDSTFTSTVELEALTNGTIQLKTSKDSYVINNFNLQLFGGKDTSAITNVINLFRNEIKSTIEQVAENYFTAGIINPSNTKLSSLSMQIPLTSNIAFYYALTADPIVTPNSLQVNIQGIFINPNKPDYNPSVGGLKSVPDYKSSSLPIQTYVSEYSLNTLTNVMYSEGYFTSVIDSTTTGMTITTTTLNYILPGIEATFTANQPCAIICDAQDYPSNVIIAPSFLYKNGLIFTTFPGVCTIKVTSIDQVAVVLDISAQANTTLSLDDWVLTGNLTILKVTDISIQQDNINGDAINTQGLMDFLNLVANLTVPFFNQRVLNSGLPLPLIPTMDLSNSELNLYDHYLSILSNPIFT